MSRWGNDWRDWQPPPGTKTTPIGDTPAAAPASARPPGHNKFGAQRTAAHDGTVLDSGHEAKVYQDLLFRVRAGEITDLRRQVRIPLDVNGVRVCEIKVDFVFHEFARNRLIYLEAKSPVTRTRQYVITRKLFKAIHGIDVEEA